MKTPMYFFRSNVLILVVVMISYALSDTLMNGVPFNPFPTTGPAWVGVGTYVVVSFALYLFRKMEDEGGNA